MEAVVEEEVETQLDLVMVVVLVEDLETLKKVALKQLVGAEATMSGKPRPLMLELEDLPKHCRFIFLSFTIFHFNVISATTTIIIPIHGFPLPCHVIDHSSVSSHTHTVSFICHSPLT